MPKPDLAELHLREAEEARARAMEHIQHGGDPVILAQDLHAAGDSYIEAAKLIALRARKATDR